MSYVHMTKINDLEAVKQILDGDIQKFTYLVNGHKDLVFTLALRMVKDKEDAEEIAQDSFIKAYNNLSRFKGEAKFSSWLYRITYNTCLDWIKKNNKRNTLTGSIDKDMYRLSVPDNASEKIEQEEHNKRITECLQRLPAADSFLISLYYYEELSLHEIATIVSSSISNVKVRLFRIRKKLAGILKENLESEIIESYERTRR